MATSSDVSYKQIIIYTYACIEPARIGRTDSESNINYCHTRHVWDDYDEVLDHQLEKWVVDKVIPDKHESVLRYLKTYIEYW